MSETYIPAGGLIGKLRRAEARLLAREPMKIDLETPIISITFDDFPKSASEAGKDAVERHDWRATWFASAGFAGTRTHHGEMFDAADLRRLQRDGHEIGCHTCSHLDATSIDPDMTLRDAERNLRALESMGLEGRPSTFAFPYGEASPAAKRALRTRYAALRGVRAGINRTGADRGLLNAVGVDGGDAGIARAVAWAEEAAENPGWLIYYVHDVQDDPTPWGCTPRQLDTVLDAVRASGARVLPMDEALDAIAA